METEIPGRNNDTVILLDELQRAVREHHKILERQAVLIRRLREELEDVRRYDDDDE